MEPVPDPCYTCRNRRIQCDQTGVPCSKCEKAGLECFDKRPFRWVKGVAIRGKMQGRSYENAGPSFTAEHASVSAKSRRALVRSSQSRLGRSNGKLSPRNMIDILCHCFENPWHNFWVLRTSIIDQPFHDHAGTFGTSPGIPFNLEDPSLLNLDQASKYYIDYCEYPIPSYPYPNQFVLLTDLDRQRTHLQALHRI